MRGILHPQRLALRAANRVTQRTLGGIPVEQKLMGPLDLRAGTSSRAHAPGLDTNHNFSNFSSS